MNGDTQLKSEYYEIPIEIRALRTATVYIVRTERNTFLIDSGMRPSTADELTKLNVDMNKIDGIIITHLHIDHIGGAMAIRKKYGPEVIMGRKDAEFCFAIGSSHKQYINFLESYYRMNGMKENILAPLIKNHPMHWEYVNYSDLEVDQLIDSGSKPLNDPDMNILMTPGHSPGSISTYTDENEIFVGDHVLKRITPNISFYDESSDMLSTYLQSLDKLEKMNFEKVNPGHGTPFRNLNGRIQEIKEHHRRRLEEVRRIVTDSNKTAFDVTLAMEWSSGRTFDSMNEFERNFAFGEAIAHLRKLLSDGVVEQKEISGLTYFKAV